MQANEDSILILLFTSNAPWIESKWNNKAFDELVAKARTSFSTVVRSALYGTIQETMYREAPNVIPLFMDLVAADHDYVQNFMLHPRGAVFSLDQVWLTAGAPRRG
jgi:peptide/nickel transport system substrate-binding protein